MEDQIREKLERYYIYTLKNRHPHVDRVHIERSARQLAKEELSSYDPQEDESRLIAHMCRPRMNA